MAQNKQGPFRFTYRAILEYLAASFLCQGDKLRHEFKELARDNPSGWREVLLLATTIAEDDKSRVMVDSLVEDDVRDVSNPADVDWQLAVLAGTVLAEREMNTPAIARVKGWLIRLLQEGKLTAKERAEAGKVLGQLGDSRFDEEILHLPSDPCLGFKHIPNALFLMGNKIMQDEEDDAYPSHPVELSSYFCAKWPVTVAQFAEFIRSSKHKSSNSTCLQGCPNHPVVNVSWHDAKAYCRWLTKQLRKFAKDHVSPDSKLLDHQDSFWTNILNGTMEVMLPSEAEWEYAACAGLQRRFPWGDDVDAEMANFIETNINETSSVGCFPKGSSPVGCEDMAGNVLEWTRSVYRKYPSESSKKLCPHKDSKRIVLRGGSCENNAEEFYCTVRIDKDPEFISSYIGFRVVVSKPRV